MDTLTHSLVGIAISRLGFKQRVPYATTALVIAANLPDLDIVFGTSGTGYLAHHRGLTHSLLAWPLWTVLVAIGLRWMARRRAARSAAIARAPAAASAMIEAGPGVRSWPVDDLVPGGTDAGPSRKALQLPGWRVCLLLGALGVGSHLLLDLTNSYGVRLLAPFSQRWFAWDLEPIVDPWLWVFLLFLLLAPMVLGLVGGEIGARKQPHRLSALIALLVVGGWIGLRAVNHARVVAVLRNRIFAGQPLRHVGAFPDAGSPERWRGVADFTDRYQLADVDAASLEMVDLVPQTIYKPQPSPAISLAESTAAGRAFLAFARFPIALTGRSDDGGTTVLLTDLRYKAVGEPAGMGVVVREDRDLRLLSAKFHWSGAGEDLPNGDVEP